MLYSFARVSAGFGDAAAGLLRAGEPEGWLRLYKKGGKRHDVPAHHRAAAALDAYIEAGKTHAARLRPRLEPPRPQPRPIWSTPCRICRPAGWLRVLAGDGTQIDITGAAAGHAAVPVPTGLATDPRRHGRA